ncbi:hypothetical protein ACH5RR_038975 [Cinchona calisaya]|uniref:Uncharacterized protein n=1 Tax=Cinchona calisaya TaxID=153742 RepID=A0ABD2Y081_9GENT
MAATISKEDEEDSTVAREIAIDAATVESKHQGFTAADVEKHGLLSNEQSCQQDTVAEHDDAPIVELLPAAIHSISLPQKSSTPHTTRITLSHPFIRDTGAVSTAAIEVINANTTGQELADDDTASLGSVIGDVTAQEPVAEAVVDPRHATTTAARCSMLPQLWKDQFAAPFAADQVRKISEQTTVAAVQSNVVGVRTSKSMSSASNMRPFATAQKCIAAVKSKNAAIEGVHNSKILDMSQANYNSIIQYNTVGIPLVPEIDDGMVGPPKYILVLPSNVKVMEKVEKHASRSRMTAQGNVIMKSKKSTLDNYSMNVDDDIINPNLSHDAPPNGTLDIPTNDDTCDDNDGVDRINYASFGGMKVVLMQEMRPIDFLSKFFSQTNMGLSIYEKVDEFLDFIYFLFSLIWFAVVVKGLKPYKVGKKVAMVLCWVGKGCRERVVGGEKGV